MIKMYKKFGNENFILKNTRPTKLKAEKYKKWLQQRGYNVRIIKNPDLLGYSIYVKNKDIKKKKEYVVISGGVILGRHDDFDDAVEDAKDYLMDVSSGDYDNIQEGGDYETYQWFKYKGEKVEIKGL